LGVCVVVVVVNVERVGVVFAAVIKLEFKGLGLKSMLRLKLLVVKLMWEKMEQGNKGGTIDEKKKK
jgi:hypothetical protein